MQKFILKNRLFLMISLFIGLTTSAQEMMFKVPLNEQITNSTEIVEGKVISKNSFWDINRQNIYTMNTIEVYKAFKGQAQPYLDIITEGGVVGMTAQITSLALELSVGDTGVFMLHGSNVQFSAENNIGRNRYQSYSAIQGFYKYEIFDNKVANPYITIDGISDQFYGAIMAQTQSNFVKVSEFDINDKIAALTQNRAGALAISTFSPASISGGTRSVLTIDGAGFGSTRGSVLFRDANSGGSTFFTTLDSQIVSWTENQILVEVPSRAGSGTFRVVTFLGPLTNSSLPLDIPYSEINVTTNDNFAYPTQHVDDSGSGGYIWSMYTTFFVNVPANQSFTRAFDSWRCETGINWDISPSFTTVNTIALDNINIVRFDVGNELPNGVLGRNTSYFNGCSNGVDLSWFVAELDIVFNDSTNWQFGPTAPSNSQTDFETVAVHELGHGHQLAHVINPSAIMHYSIGNGVTNRFLSNNDIQGGNDVQARNTTNPVCGLGLMTNHSCSLGIDENDLAVHISVFPNPAKNQIFIKNDQFFSIDSVQIFDNTGRSVMNLKSQPISTLYTLETSALSSGVYIMKIGVEGKSLIKKIIIE